MEKRKARTAAYRANRQDELDSAALYRALSEAEERPELAQVYARLEPVESQNKAQLELGAIRTAS